MRLLAPGQRRFGRASAAEQEERGIVSRLEWRDQRTRWSMRTVQWATLAFLLAAGLGPLLWLAKSAVTPTHDTIATPMALWPNGLDLGQFERAWNRFHIDRYFFNTVWVAVGSWLTQLLVATTAAYALSVLRPRFGNVLFGLVLATLFVPGVVLLVPLYLTILNVPILNVNLLNQFWAVWLPAGASAFNVVLMKRFFDGLPREIFEAARVDGAGPLRLFRSIVLPMSRPIIGVVSVFALINAWKDYLWPLLVLPDPSVQPLSVRLPLLARTTDLGVVLAALFITTAIPVVLFLLFQRMFLSGGGLSGAIKG